MPSSRRARSILAVLAVALVALAATALADNGTVLVAGSSGDVDLHAEGQLISGNVQIKSERAPDEGQALDRCDPDPRPAPNVRPSCAWLTPAGTGEEQVQLGRGVGRPDTDSSPNGSYTPATDADSRERINGVAGFEDDGSVEFEGHFFDDEDMHVRLTPRTLDAYLAPEGDANNRWRRICGTGVVEQHNNSGSGGSSSHPPLAPFLAGQVRKFVLQTWDADWRDPSDNDGGNQDYWIIDVLAPGSSFDTTRCDVANPPAIPGQPPSGQQPAGATPGSSGSAPVVAEEAPSVRGPALRGSARLSGPGGCRSRAFRATVVGENIAQVTFSMDGRRIRTLIEPDSQGRWRLRIVPRRLRVGTHQVVAGVSFRVGAQPRIQRVRLTFRRCQAAQQRVAPRFTG